MSRSRRISSDQRRPIRRNNERPSRATSVFGDIFNWNSREKSARESTQTHSLTDREIKHANSTQNARYLFAESHSNCDGHSDQKLDSFRLLLLFRDTRDLDLSSKANKRFALVCLPSTRKRFQSIFHQCARHSNATLIILIINANRE